MTDRNALADASLSDIRQKLFELNRRGDLDAVPVTPPDDTNWLQRFSAFVTGGGPWGTAQPGQRGAWVPKGFGRKRAAPNTAPRSGQPNRHRAPLPSY